MKAHLSSQALVEQIDTDGDGTVDFAEFVAMLRKARTDDTPASSAVIPMLDVPTHDEVRRTSLRLSVSMRRSSFTSPSCRRSTSWRLRAEPTIVEAVPSSAAITTETAQRSASEQRVLDACGAIHFQLTTMQAKHDVQSRSRLTKWCVTIFEHHWFDTAVMSTIGLNTLNLAVEHHRQPAWLTSTNFVLNALFTFTFVLEVGIKIRAMGIFLYLWDRFNAFDALITILSVAELLTGASGFSVMRCFRLLRVLTLMKYFPTMRKQLQIMSRTLDSVLPFMFLLFLFLFMAAVMAVNIFGGR